MLSDLEASSKFIEAAKVPEDVFGKIDDGSVDSQLNELKHKFHKIVATVHPDKFIDDHVVARANIVFAKLVGWRKDAEFKIRAGSYGDRKPAAPPPPAPVIEPQIVKTPKQTYTVTELLAQGDLADLYACTYGAAAERAIFKVAQSPADNDLLENESKILGTMYPAKQAEEKFYRYLPKPLDTFMLRSPSGTNRRVNVMQRAEGYFSLEEVLRAYPKGLDFKDVVWMFKRLLAGLGYAHNQKNVIHGAITPAHVLVHPTEHGAKIIDWCYAVPNWKDAKGYVKAVSIPYKAYYAPEILAKKPPTPATDMYMAAKCAVALLGGDIVTNQVADTVPKQIQAFLGSCLLLGQNKRPDDAWKLHEEFDELLKRLVGKPKYRPLTMPSK